MHRCTTRVRCSSPVPHTVALTEALQSCFGLCSGQRCGKHGLQAGASSREHANAVRERALRLCVRAHARATQKEFEQELERCHPSICARGPRCADAPCSARFKPPASRGLRTRRDLQKRDIFDMVRGRLQLAFAARTHRVSLWSRVPCNCRCARAAGAGSGRTAGPERSVSSSDVRLAHVSHQVGQHARRVHV